ncbi:Sarcosine/dimethylglycine N-methyltransferase [Nitrospina watsonii]|uniref:Sarcosine/dimethylglycine N-methyltransferase n=2 Tax=Nitrospina watsonii TaxID=1323948 RepID=A0ABM9HA99_9BACT|nr:Sarcosine/dimethylglycine N-methyltransferase [Nitrospina watsonii]
MGSTTKDNTTNAVDKAEEYYDSSNADQFYFRIWGGEHIHIGLYNYEEEPIGIAGKRIVDHMSDILDLTIFKKVLDLGAGYGGGARYLATHNGCHVTCLNLSETQNNRNREFNKERKLDHLVDVAHGSFEDIPFEANSFDVVWSQDSFLHSADRARVVAEAYRVLKPGGMFIFTDIMKADDCPDDSLGPILARIHLSTLGSFKFYYDEASKAGFRLKRMEDHSHQLTRHYSRVRDETQRQYDEVVEICGKEYIDRMLTGLGHWVDAGNSGRLAWGITCFEKPAAS